MILILCSDLTLPRVTMKIASFVQRNDNLPNIPHARLLENFWAFLSPKFYHGGCESQNAEKSDVVLAICRKLRLVEEIKALLV